MDTARARAVLIGSWVVRYRFEMSDCLDVIDENDAKFEWNALHLNL